MRFVDSHCHPQFPDYDTDRTEMLTRMRAAGVAAVAVGTDAQSSLAAAQLARSEQDIWAGVGFHPNDLPKSDAEFDAVQSLIPEPRIVAVGETGLDYFRSNNRAEQMVWFRRHLDLASLSGKPAIVHLRDRAGEFQAYDDALGALNEYRGLRFVLHCYSGDVEHARSALQLGGFISFTGILTFANAYELRAVAKSVPLERTLIETDAPYLAPAPNRGKRNEPAWVVRVAETLAEIHGVPLDTVADRTSANAQQLFRI